MLSRVCPSATGPAAYVPLSSGPRCRSVRVMAATASAPGGPAYATTPQMPQIGLGPLMRQREAPPAAEVHHRLAMGLADHAGHALEIHDGEA